MKLQFLGDLKDAMKWDVLHCVMMASLPELSGLVVVPMLTPDDGSGQGQVSPASYPGDSHVMQILEELRKTKCLDPIRKLGTPAGSHVYGVAITRTTVLTAGEDRSGLLDGVDFGLPQTLYFLDPDTGFEPSKATVAHVTYHEIGDIVMALSEDSALAVFQHHKQGVSWPRIIDEIRQRYKGPAVHICAVYGYQTALAFFAKDAEVAGFIDGKLQALAQPPRALTVDQLPDR